MKEKEINDKLSKIAFDILTKLSSEDNNPQKEEHVITTYDKLCTYVDSLNHTVDIHSAVGLDKPKENEYIGKYVRAGCGLKAIDGVIVDCNDNNTMFKIKCDYDGLIYDYSIDELQEYKIGLVLEPLCDNDDYSDDWH
jgi:hypothetical protein